MKLVKFGEARYPYSSDYGPRWMLDNGDHVGCHKGTTTPLGHPADAATRRMRMHAHSAFDRLWKGERALMKRGQAYAALSKAFGYTVHIGQSDSETCYRIIKWAHEQKPLVIR